MVLRSRCVRTPLRLAAKEAKSGGKGAQKQAAADGKGVVIKEGQAAIVFGQNNEVFYNKVQVFNRDLSILAIKTFVEDRKKEIAERAAKKAEKAKARAESKGSKPAAGEAAAESKSEEKSTDAGKADVFDGIRILEGLSATGLRSIRYFKEIPHVKSILVNDLDEGAVKAIRRNIEHNGLSPGTPLCSSFAPALVSACLPFAS